MSSSMAASVMHCLEMFPSIATRSHSPIQTEHNHHPNSAQTSPSSQLPHLPPQPQELLSINTPLALPFKELQLRRLLPSSFTLRPHWRIIRFGHLFLFKPFSILTLDFNKSELVWFRRVLEDIKEKAFWLFRARGPDWAVGRFEFFNE